MIKTSSASTITLSTLVFLLTSLHSLPLFSADNTLDFHQQRAVGMTSDCLNASEQSVQQPTDAFSTQTQRESFGQWIKDSGIKSVLEVNQGISLPFVSDISLLSINTTPQDKRVIALLEYLHRYISNTLQERSYSDMKSRLKAIAPYLAIRFHINNESEDLGSAGAPISKMVESFDQVLRDPNTSSRDRRLAIEFLGSLANTPFLNAENKEILVEQLVSSDANNWITYSAIEGVKNLLQDPGPQRDRIVIRLFNLLTHDLSYIRYRSLKVLSAGLTNNEILSAQFSQIVERALKDEVTPVRIGAQKILYSIVSTRNSDEISKAMLLLTKKWKDQGILDSNFDIRFYEEINFEAAELQEHEDIALVENTRALVRNPASNRKAAIRIFEKNKGIELPVSSAEASQVAIENFSYVDNLTIQNKDEFRYGASLGLQIVAPKDVTSDFIELLLNQSWFESKGRIRQNTLEFLMQIDNGDLVLTSHIRRLETISDNTKGARSPVKKGLHDQANMLKAHFEQLLK